MSTQPYQQLFHVLQAIAEIPELEINKLSSIFHPVTLTAGEHLSKAGEVPRSLCFIYQDFYSSIVVVKQVCISPPKPYADN